MAENKQTTTRDWAADRAICEGATPGPWVQLAYGDRSLVSGNSVIVEPIGDDMSYLEVSEADARFIAEARTGWPAALDRIAELEAENERLQSRVDKLDGYNEFNTQYITELSSEIQRYRQALESIAKAGPHIFVRQIAKEALEYDEADEKAAEN